MEKEEVILPPINEEDWMWSGLCYPFWFIFSPWTLKTKKKDDLFLYFHALQGLHFGILTSIITLISTLIVYFGFFRPNMEQIAVTTGDQMNSRLTCGAFAVIVMLGFLFFMAFILFITLYYGWRAASGKMFKIPFIGNRAWATVYEKKEEVESEYYQSPLGRMELMAKQRTAEQLSNIPDPRQETLPPAVTVEPAPPAALEITVPLKEDGAVDYEALMRQMPPIDKIKSIFAQQQPVPVEEEHYIPTSSPTSSVPPVVQEERQLSPLEKLALLRKQQSQKEQPVDTSYSPQEELVEEEEEAYVEILQESPTPIKSPPVGMAGEEVPLLFREDMQSLSPEEQIALLRKQQELEQRKAEVQEEVTGEEIGILQEEIEEVEEIPEPRSTTYLDPGEMFLRIQQQRLGMISPEEKEPSQELKETVSSAPPVKHMSPLEQLSLMRKQHKERQEQLGFTEEEEETRSIPRAQPTGRLDPSILFGITEKEPQEQEPPIRHKAASTTFLKKIPDNLSPLEKLSLRKKQQEMEETPEEPAMKGPAPIPTSRLDPAVLLWGSKPDSKISMGTETPVKKPSQKEKPLTHLEKLAKLQQKKELHQKTTAPTTRAGKSPIMPRGIKPKSPLEQLAARQKEKEAEKQENKDQIISSVQEKSQRMKDLLNRMKDRTRGRGDEEGGDDDA